jgi:Flp pilus assembly protein TadD
MAAIEYSAGRTNAADEQLRLARQQLEHSLSSPQLSALLGSLLLRMRRWQEAEELYGGALRMGGGDAQVCIGLSSACLGQGRDEDALRWARQAFDLAPEDARAAYQLGLSLLAMGQKSEAAAALHCALDLNDSLLGAHRRLGELYANALYDPARQRLHERRAAEIQLQRRAEGRAGDEDEGLEIA